MSDPVGSPARLPDGMNLVTEMGRLTVWGNRMWNRRRRGETVADEELSDWRGAMAVWFAVAGQGGAVASPAPEVEAAPAASPAETKPKRRPAARRTASTRTGGQSSGRTDDRSRTRRRDGPAEGSKRLRR
jgi:hypothetical protein